MPANLRADWAPFELIIFDCDSTLSAIEGIDELARWQGRAEQVAELTHRAMNGDVPLETVYGERLELLKPTRDQLRKLGQLYRRHLVPGADQVIAALQAAGRQVFIVSRGLGGAGGGVGPSRALPARRLRARGGVLRRWGGAAWRAARAPPRGENHAADMGHWP